MGWPSLWRYPLKFFKSLTATFCERGSVVVMEEEQTRHSRSDYPDVFFYGFMPVVVYNRKRGLVNLEVICGQYFLPEFQIKWPEKLADRSEPAVQCVFWTVSHPDVPAVSLVGRTGHDIRISVKDLSEHGSPWHTFIYGHQWHGSGYYSLFLRYQRPPFHFSGRMWDVPCLSHRGSRVSSQRVLVCSSPILTYLLKSTFSGSMTTVTTGRLSMTTRLARRFIGGQDLGTVICSAALLRASSISASICSRSP